MYLDVRNLLLCREIWIQGSPSEFILPDLISVQCRFESDRGHRSPYGSMILDQDSDFRGVQSPPLHLFDRARQRTRIRYTVHRPSCRVFILEQLKTCPTTSLRAPLTLHRCPLHPGRRRLRHRVLSNRQLACRVNPWCRKVVSSLAVRKVVERTKVKTSYPVQPEDSGIGLHPCEVSRLHRACAVRRSVEVAVSPGATETEQIGLYCSGNLERVLDSGHPLRDRGAVA
ncbi:hypothetical protein ABIB34_004015 [Rhodococcus sp. UYP5]